MGRTTLLNHMRWWRKPRHWTRVVLPLAGVAGLYLVGRTVELHEHLSAAQQWLAGFGVWAVVVYGFLFVAATLLFLPGTPFTVVAALLFGPWPAFLLMVAATTVSAAVAFLISRYWAKGAIERQLGRRGNFDRLRELVEANRWFAIPAIRFLPMFPFSFNNYALGLTNISFRSYLIWSELVFVPMNGVLVLGASALYNALVLGETSWALIGGTTAAGVLVLGIGFAAKRSFGGPAGAVNRRHPESG